MPSRSNRLRRARPLLGTLVGITAAGSGPAAAAAVEAAFAAIGRVHRLMSFHRADSDVSRINRAPAGHVVALDPQTYRVLQCAQQISALSDGAFDIVTAAVLVRSGLLPQTVPAPAEAATQEDLELLPDHRVRWRRKGLIDLGGIAKGYAVDCATAALQARGIASGMVNAGGDLRCFGEAQAIQVRRPQRPTDSIPLGMLQDGAIATSSGYFSGVEADGRRLDPLVDPRQQACTAWEASVSVVAADCMRADALTKVVRLAYHAAPELLPALGAQAIVLDAQGLRSCGATRLDLAQAA